MSMLRKLAALAAAAEVARRYARNNPDKAGKMLDQAAEFADRQTKGKYSAQISGATNKAKSVAGIAPTHGAPNPGGAPGNGFVPGHAQGETGRPYPGAAKH